MRHTMRGRTILFLTIGLLCGRLAMAVPVGFTQRALYDVATAGLTGMNTLDFESIPVGVLPAGPHQGITFAFSIGTFNPKVIDQFDTTSGTHSLGTTGDDVFLAGDSFTMTFAPTNAIGLYVIAADIILDGDFTLSGGGGSVNNTAATDTGFPGGLPDGGKVYFLGLVDLVTPFTSATLSSVGFPADFIFNVDDIVGQIEPAGPRQPVPEPATFALLAVGLATTYGVRRKRAVR